MHCSENQTHGRNTPAFRLRPELGTIPLEALKAHIFSIYIINCPKSTINLAAVFDRGDMGCFVTDMGIWNQEICFRDGSKERLKS